MALLVCYPHATKSHVRVILDAKTGMDQGVTSMALWQKGQSGNPAGRKRKHRFDDYLQEALATKRGANARALVQKLIDEGLKGNIYALKVIAERIGGKPKTATDSAVANGHELTLEQVRVKLAELLSRPEVRRNLQTMLTESKPETDTLQ
jgi:hypothetical protein